MLNLSKSGWILSDSGLKSIESLATKGNLTKTLLDRDLREIGAGISDLQKGRFDDIVSKGHEIVILQILKIRNISAPKANESSKTAPKLLKIQLTDGVNTLSAIEMEPTSLSIETKPGTKIAVKITQMKMANGQLLFTPKNIDILGGYVEALVSKWEVSRSLAGMKGSRTGAAGGPPPFIPFGQKIQQNVPNTEKGFKSLATSKPKESENDDSEFKAQRQDAIAEAAKAGTKKTFGGGSKTLVDGNVQKIMDKGYTEEQATTALKYSRNSVEKALSNLKRRDEHQKRAASGEYEPREYSKDKRGGKANNAEPASAKPSGAVSLFDFLENKFPTNQDSHNERFENNISSSFRKPADKDFGGKPWAEQKSSQNYKGGYEKRDYGGRGGDYRSGSGYQPREERRFGGDGRDGKTRDYRGEGQRENRESHRENRESYRENRENPRENRESHRENRESQRENPRDHYRESHRDQRDNNTRDSKYQQPSNNYQAKPSGTQNQYQKPSNGNYNSNHAEKGKFQKSDYNTAKSKDFNNYNSRESRDFKDSRDNRDPRDNRDNRDTRNPRDTRDNRENFKSRTSQPSKYYNDQSTRNITESMDKMSLKNHQQQYKQPDPKLTSANYPPLTTTEPPKAKTYPAPTGYPVGGFQSKEANEQAKNALKTKTVPVQQPPKQQQQNWQQPQQPPATQQHPIPVKVIKSQPPPPFSNPPGVTQPAPAPMHSLPQPFAHPGVIHAMPAVIPTNPPPAVFHQTFHPAPIIMQSVPPPPGMAPPPVSNPQQMKIGDVCLAKYWEDGQFYNAKITGVSDSTYVVLFPEYGNAEEVRKIDCVPLVPACPTPPSNFVQAPPQQSYQRVQNFQQAPPPGYNKTTPGKNQPRRN